MTLPGNPQPERLPEQFVIPDVQQIASTEEVNQSDFRSVIAPSVSEASPVISTENARLNLSSILIAPDTKVDRPNKSKNKGLLIVGALAASTALLGTVIGVASWISGLDRRNNSNADPTTGPVATAMQGGETSGVPSAKTSASQTPEKPVAIGGEIPADQMDIVKPKYSYAELDAMTDEQFALTSPADRAYYGWMLMSDVLKGTTTGKPGTTTDDKNSFDDQYFTGGTKTLDAMAVLNTQVNKLSGPQARKLAYAQEYWTVDQRDNTVIDPSVKAEADTYEANSKLKGGVSNRLVPKTEAPWALMPTIDGKKEWGKIMVIDVKDAVTGAVINSGQRVVTRMTVDLGDGRIGVWYMNGGDAADGAIK